VLTRFQSTEIDREEGVLSLEGQTQAAGGALKGDEGSAIWIQA
jgi:hypothetical protein